MTAIWAVFWLFVAALYFVWGVIVFFVSLVVALPISLWECFGPYSRRRKW